MNSILEYINSGILEMYVLGICSDAEVREVEQMANKHSEINQEIERLRKDVEFYAEAHAQDPPLTVKPMLMAMIDYAERIKNGEVQSCPAELNEGSKINDYTDWLNRSDMILPQQFNGIHVKIIGYTPKATTAILWIKDMAPPEVHDDEYEKFLIVEGTCDITIDTTVHHLVPGDYLAIPLHSTHHVKITSEIPCKAILQRIAA
jgi:mannose-6-phosphate isomerase-like protein (cupin superfamily)